MALCQSIVFYSFIFCKSIPRSPPSTLLEVNYTTSVLVLQFLRLSHRCAFLITVRWTFTFRLLSLGKGYQLIYLVVLVEAGGVEPPCYTILYYCQQLFFKYTKNEYKSQELFSVSLISLFLFNQMVFHTHVIIWMVYTQISRYILSS